MAQYGKNIDELELEASDYLHNNPGYRQLFKVLPGRAYSLGNRALAAAAPTDLNQIAPSDLVSRILLARMIQDLRACYLLAGKAYAAQAATIAASIQENLFIFMEILISDEAAEKWIEVGSDDTYDDNNYSPERISNERKFLRSHPLNYDTCRKNFFSRMSPDRDPAAQLEIAKLEYAQLCALKHMHPSTQAAMQVKYVVEHGSGNVTATQITAVPVLGTEEISSAGFALSSACRAVIASAHAFYMRHSSNPDSGYFMFKEAVDSVATAYDSMKLELESNNSPG